MGLDIFFFKTKNQSDNIDTAYDEVNEESKAKFKNFIDNSIKKLIASKKKAVNFEEDFEKFLKSLKKYLYDYELDRFKTDNLTELEDLLNKRLNYYFPQEDAYFRKVNFVYRFFQDKLVDESCFATKEDIEELISRCDKVLKDKSLATELLPTQSGFFFGSIEYDKWYFNDVRNCRKQMKRLLKSMKDNERVIVSMSW